MLKPFHFAAIIVAILSALLIAEAFVRLLKIAPEIGFIEKGRFRLSANPKLGYEPVPNLTYQGEDLGFYDYRGEANSLGFRDYEHNVVKQNGVFRVAILGDSIAAGWGILEGEKTFPRLLGKDLTAQGLNAEVMNFAVSGYNTQQEVEIFKDKGTIFQPDLVIITYNLTDTQKIDGGILNTLKSQEMKSPNLISSHNQFERKSHLFRIIKFSLFNKSTIEQDDFTQDTVENSLKELSSLSSKHNFQVLVIVFPRFDYLQNYPFVREHINIKNYAIDNGFPYLDLLPSLQECSKTEIVYIDIYHPSENGHICAAKVTASYIINNLR